MSWNLANFLFSISALIIISFILLTLDLICSSFSSFLRWKFRWLITDLSVLMYAFNSINIPVSTAFVASHKFGKLCFRFHLFISKYLKFFWDFYFGHVLFRSVLFNNQVFSSYFLLCFSNLNLLWTENRHCLYFYTFKFVKVCFMSENAVYLGEWPMWVWEECVFWCCWMNTL